MEVPSGSSPRLRPEGRLIAIRWSRRAGAFELNEDGPRVCVADILAKVPLSVEPPRLPGGQLDIDIPPAHPEPAPERRESHHDAVRVSVHRGLVARVIVVFQDADAVILEKHAVSVGV